MTKISKQLERHFKGIANHRRIDILFLINRHAGCTVEEVAKNLGVNIKTISEHLRRLVQAGLVNKKYRGRHVAHTLSPYGKMMIKLVTTFHQAIGL